MKKTYAIGIDIGGQTAKMGLVDAHGKVLEQAVIRSDDTTNASKFITNLADATKQLIKNCGIQNIQGIGIGAPNGNYYQGVIENAVNLTWGSTRSIPIAQMMSKKLGLPVVLTNDANAAAVGEMQYGIAGGMEHFIMITLGTGVGSGIVVNGQVLYGHDGFAGELGHVTIVRNGRLCNCGKRGCLEAYASANGVARSAREILETTDRKSMLRNYSFSTITSKDVYEAAVGGDEIAQEIFAYTGQVLGEAFANFVAFSSPQAIILFGGLSKAGNYLYEPIVQHMNLNLLPQWRNKIQVLSSSLKESDAAILGASALAWEF